SVKRIIENHKTATKKEEHTWFEELYVHSCFLFLHMKQELTKKRCGHSYIHSKAPSRKCARQRRLVGGWLYLRIVCPRSVISQHAATIAWLPLVFNRKALHLALHTRE